MVGTRASSDASGATPRTTTSRWAPLVAAVLLAGLVGLTPAAGAVPPPFGITPLPATVAAGTTLTVSGVGCPRTPPPAVTVGANQVLVQVWRSAEGHNDVSSTFRGSPLASTWETTITAVGFPSESISQVAAEEDGSWEAVVSLPWFAPGGGYQVRAWCGTLGPAGPFEDGSALGVEPASAAFSTAITGAAPGFTRLADRTGPELLPSDTTFVPPNPSADDLLVATPGATIDLSGTGCHPPSGEDPPTQREVELVGSPVQAGAPPLGPQLQRLPYVSVNPTPGGELQVEPRPLPSPGGFLVRAALNADGSWTASTTIPADSATTGTYVVVAQCLTGASGLNGLTLVAWQQASQTYGAVPLTAPSTTTTFSPPPTTVTPAFTG